MDSKITQETKKYISITGLKLKSQIHTPVFTYHAMRSMLQAQTAKGNLSAAAKTIYGIHHTLSTWETKEAMQDYLTSGAHAKALKVFSRIATGKVYGYYSTEVPHWDKVHQLWKTKGMVV